MKMLIGKRIVCLVLASAAGASTSLGAVLVDFDTAGEFTSNFYKVNADGVYTDVGPAYENWSTPLTPRTAAVYDTSPDDRGTRDIFGSVDAQEVYSVDFRINTDIADAIGVTGRMNNGGTDGFLVTMNLDNGEKYMQLGSFTGTFGRTPVLFGSGYQVRIGGGDGGGPTNPVVAGAWYKLQLVVQNDGADVDVFGRILDITGATTLFTTPTYTEVASPLTGAGEAGLRFQANTGGASIDFDNFDVTIPEPSSVVLAGLGACALAMRRRTV